MQNDRLSKGKLNQTLTLEDGRQLAYAYYGDPDGTPVIYCHGSPGSRLDLANMNEEIKQAGVHLIAPDRPGIGLSDFIPGYQLVDWPDDAIQLADNLGLDQFFLLGLSGGGPFCAASTFELSDRVKRAAIVSGLGFLDTPGVEDGLSESSKRIFGLAQRANWMLRLQYWLMARGLAGDPDRVITAMHENLPAPDRALLDENPEEVQTLLLSIGEALRVGSKGVSHEWSLYANPWGFRLEDIQVEVSIWHGEEDMNAPIVMGRQMAEAITQSTSHFLPGEGHLSLFNNYMDEILSELVA